VENRLRVYIGVEKEDYETHILRHRSQFSLVLAVGGAPLIMISKAAK
jgi:hypothetical protein